MLSPCLDGLVAENKAFLTLLREESSGSSSWKAGFPGSLNVTDVVGMQEPVPAAALQVGRIRTKMSRSWLGTAMSFSSAPASCLRRACDVRYGINISSPAITHPGNIDIEHQLWNS